METDNDSRPRAHSAPASWMLSARVDVPYDAPGTCAAGRAIAGLVEGASPHPPLQTLPHPIQHTQSTLLEHHHHPHHQQHHPHHSCPASQAHQHITRVRQISVCSRRESFEMRCCRINVLLVTMQLCLGISVTALGFYMQTLTPALRTRECPFWAGVPLLIAGVIGIYFCATDFAAYAAKLSTFVVKVICFILSAICVFLCMIGSVFPGIHGSRISSYVRCNISGIHCYCAETEDPQSRIFVYENIVSCDLVITTVKDYLILQCALNAIASGVCLWFVTLLWKSRYQSFYSGLQTSYNPSVPARSWTHAGCNQPYVNSSYPPPSPILLHKSPPLKQSLTYRNETDDSDVQEPLKNVDS